MLHYSALTGTVIYCAETQLTATAHHPLEALLAAALRLGRSLPPGSPSGALTVRVALADHDQMPGPLHSVGPARIRPQAVKAWVCDQHLTAELAQWLGALCTAQGKLSWDL